MTKLEALELSASAVRSRLAALEKLIAKTPQDATSEMVEIAREAADKVRASLVEVEALIVLAKRNGET